MRTLVLPLAAAVLATSLSCQDDQQHFLMVFDPCDPLVLELPGDISAERRDAIERGIESWRQVANIATATSGPLDARRLEIRFAETDWYMGRFDDQEGAIWLAERVTNPDVLAVVLAHELGHAFGMYHVEPGERVSVMNPGNKTLTPNAEDAAYLEHMWGACISAPVPTAADEASDALAR